MKNTQEIFWTRMSRRGGCLEFTGQKSTKGYGCFSLEGKGWSAHRLAWTYTFGPIPEGLSVCHQCDNRICMNPMHLFLGTAKDNTQDAIKKGRLPQGHSHSHSVFTPEQVEEIRTSQNVSGMVLAKKFGVCSTAILYCRKGITYQKNYPPFKADTSTWYQRDASFFEKPNTSKPKKWHLSGPLKGWSLCAQIIIDDWPETTPLASSQCKSCLKAAALDQGEPK